jgi:putative hemolysin
MGTGVAGRAGDRKDLIGARSSRATTTTGAAHGASEATMTTSDWALLATVFALFLFSIVLAVGETAFVRMSLARARSLEEEGRRGAKRLVALLEQEHPETTLNVVLLVVLFAQLTAAALLGSVLNDVAGAWGFVAGVVVQFVAFFVLAEAAPKTWVIQHTDTAALRSAPVLTFLTWFPPLRVLARALIGMANVILPGKGIKEGPFVTELEIREMVDLAADEFSIESGERELIHSIFEFGDAVAREVMTPRTDMYTIEAGTPVDEAIARAIEKGYSRLPVVEGGQDNVVGIAILKDLVAARGRGCGAEPVDEHMRTARFVPEQKKLAELLQEMKAEKFHLAIVVDEYGGTAGLVTLEDLVEELVGEIEDEFDVEEPQVERLPDGRIRVPGRTHIDELSEELDIELPNTEWDTIAGLVFNTLGHVPTEGETVLLDRLELVAERVQGRRIVSVLVTVRDAGDACDPVAASDDGSG